jgi:hypothetical protein
MRLGQYTARVTNLQVREGLDTQPFQTLVVPSGENWHAMWPKVQTLWWTAPPEQLQYLKYFLTSGVRNLKVNFEDAGDEEFQATLCLIESHCENLYQLHLFDSESRENKALQDTIRRIIHKNSSTLRMFMPPQDPSSPLVEDILRLPQLQELVMHVPKVPDSLPSGILPSLKSLTFSLHDPLDIPKMLGKLRETKLLNFVLHCPYPTSPGERKALAKFFEISGLYDSLRFFVWKPPSGGEAPTWSFATLFQPFANLQALQLDITCYPTCCFKFGHDHVVQISQWMPRLRDLNFGGSPCPFGGTNTNIGYNTLAVLAKNCPNLYLLSIHFDIKTFGLVNWRVEPNPNVTLWDVGATVLPEDPETRTFIALAVAKLFPNVTFVGTAPEKWADISEELEMLALPPVHGLFYW